MTPAISIVQADPRGDAPVLRQWLADPHAAFWGMGDLDVDAVRAYLAGVAADPRQQAWLGLVDGVPTFFAETYDPAEVLLRGIHDPLPGDLGMHVLIAPPDGEPRHGLTDAVFAAVMRWCFDELGAQRVVVEPDARNDRIRRKNLLAGFTELRCVDIDDGDHTKTAVLSVCTRDDYARSELGARTRTRTNRDPRMTAPAAHLSPTHFARAQRHLVAKAIAEFSHERLLAPEPTVDGWRIVVSGADVQYRFEAVRTELEHWVLDEASLIRLIGGEPAELDAQEFILELQPVLGLSDQLLPIYLEEIASTLASAAFKIAQGGPSADELLTADLPTIESAMTEGHPGFVANNGRIGFGVSAHAAYSPEAGRPFHMVWLAARRSTSHLALGAGLDEASLLSGELSSTERARFAERLTELGEDPADFHLLPVHPWQWENRIAITFAPDVARRDLVLIGESDDDYRAQQSVRTMFNATHPERHYVKTALAVQNMGFLRGLSPAYMRVTPAINDWVAELVAGDATLRGAGFRVLRERASIGYTGDAYHRTPTPSAHRKMLAALWRESPMPLIAPGERLATMASLLHRDANGRSYATALVRASGIDATTWVRAYLRVYLRPLVHCLRAHDLAFMPHGENLILILDGHVPTGVFMKDIGEEVALLADRAVPDDVRRIVSPVDDEEKALAIFTDVFDGVLRHLAGILHTDGTLPESEFWRIAAEIIDEHEAQHPSLESRVDLRADAFAHSCLNRLQLRNTLQMVDLANQSASLMYAGALSNPVARWRVGSAAVREPVGV